MKAELTAAQVAERLKVGRSTVNLWCRQGRFPGARVEDSPVGQYWLIPESDLKTFAPPKMGRPSLKPKTNGTTPSKRAKKGGLPATPKLGTVETQTKTTRRLDQGVKRVAEKEMGGVKKGGRK
jgi:excisionase family DNA binding protein